MKYTFKYRQPNRKIFNQAITLPTNITDHNFKDIIYIK